MHVILEHFNLVMMKKRQNVLLEAAETNGQHPVLVKYFAGVVEHFISHY